MKLRKIIISFTMMTLMAVTVPLMATDASAATATAAAAKPDRCYSARTGRYYLCKKPNFYRRHRKAINIGAGAGVGALVGGLLGGGKWAAIGGLAGAGGGALFTHKQRPKNYTQYYRQY
jgi:outer membrane lipoprotein SlyB